MSIRGYGSASHGTALAGTASGTILAANTNRKYLYIQNDSDTVVYLSFGTAAAVLNKGVRLSGTTLAGNTYEMSKEKGNVFTGVIMGIASAASKTILLTEA